MDLLVLTGLILLAGAGVSALLFGPIARRFVAGDVSMAVSGLFMLHALLGGLLLLGAYLLAKHFGHPVLVPLAAAALGWTVPALLIAWHTARKLKDNKKTRKEV